MKIRRQNLAYWPTFALLQVLLSVAAHAGCDKVVISSDPDYRPLHWYDGQTLRGASIDLAARIFSDLKIPFEIRYVGPWKRVLINAQAGKVDLIATLKRNSERETYLKFTDTIAFASPTAIFVAKNKQFHYSSREDLRGRVGGITLGNKFGNDLDEYIAKYLTVEEATSHELNFKKLQLNRIDYFLVGLYPGLVYLSENGISESIATATTNVADNPNYFGFALNSDCLVHFDAFEARLKELSKQEVPQRLVSQHLARLGTEESPPKR